MPRTGIIDDLCSTELGNSVIGIRKDRGLVGKAVTLVEDVTIDIMGSMADDLFATDAVASPPEAFCGAEAAFDVDASLNDV